MLPSALSPPAAAPPSPQVFTATSAFRFPPNRRCLKLPATLALKYLAPKSGPIVQRFEAWIGKRRLTQRTGRNARASITLSKLPTKTFELTIKVTPTGGKTVTAKRTYNVCKAAKHRP